MLKLIGDGRWVVERLLLFVAIAGLTLIFGGVILNYQAAGQSCCW